MDAIADEIMQKQPHVLGLQEVFRIRIQVPSSSFVYDPSIPGFTFANFYPNQDGSITFIPDAKDNPTTIFSYLLS
jgi:hypothetical protein